LKASLRPASALCGGPRPRCPVFALVPFPLPHWRTRPDASGHAGRATAGPIRANPATASKKRRHLGQGGEPASGLFFRDERRFSAGTSRPESGRACSRPEQDLADASEGRGWRARTWWWRLLPSCRSAQVARPLAPRDGVRKKPISRLAATNRLEFFVRPRRDVREPAPPAAWSLRRRRRQAGVIKLPTARAGVSTVARYAATPHLERRQSRSRATRILRRIEDIAVANLLISGARPTLRPHRATGQNLPESSGGHSPNDGCLLPPRFDAARQDLILPRCGPRRVSRAIRSRDFRQPPVRTAKAGRCSRRRWMVGRVPLARPILTLPAKRGAPSTASAIENPRTSAGGRSCRSPPTARRIDVRPCPSPPSARRRAHLRQRLSPCPRPSLAQCPQLYGSSTLAKGPPAPRPTRPPASIYVLTVGANDQSRPSPRPSVATASSTPRTERRIFRSCGSSEASKASLAESSEGKRPDELSRPKICGCSSRAGSLRMPSKRIGYVGRTQIRAAGGHLVVPGGAGRVRHQTPTFAVGAGPAPRTAAFRAQRKFLPPPQRHPRNLPRPKRRLLERPPRSLTFVDTHQGGVSPTQRNSCARSEADPPVRPPSFPRPTAIALFDRSLVDSAPSPRLACGVAVSEFSRAMRPARALESDGERQLISAADDLVPKGVASSRRSSPSKPCTTSTWGIPCRPV